MLKRFLVTVLFYYYVISSPLNIFPTFNFFWKREINDRNSIVKLGYNHKLQLPKLKLYNPKSLSHSLLSPPHPDTHRPPVTLAFSNSFLFLSFIHHFFAIEGIRRIGHPTTPSPPAPTPLPAAHHLRIFFMIVSMYIYLDTCAC